MPTAADYLALAYNQAAQRLSELDTLPLSERARMTYSVDGRMFDWNGYRQHLLDQLKELPALMQQAPGAGPFTVVDQVCG